jgi:amino acid transporter
MASNSSKFGTAPVFFTAISTILGAILFLRFGWAMGNLGFYGVLLVIIIGHMVTIPTALAISEIATNKRVEGGGEYFIISRSFGLNIGATIGISLFFSQAISVAFYVVAFTEAFFPMFEYVKETYNFIVPRQCVSLPALGLLALIILKKGASLGVKALYIVVAILAVSLLAFFLGKPMDSQIVQASDWSLFANFKNTDKLFFVLAVVFPGFTGITAGVGLSGDLKNPKLSIPLGTSLATLFGMIIYVFVVYKLKVSATAADLSSNQFIMSKIAFQGSILIPLGLAASTISSALGSVMVAPRTLQALGFDNSFSSKKLNKFFAKGKGESNEPYNTSIVTFVIASFFVILGDVNIVAEIITMFFMLTYGTLCLISFLNHFGSDPSYRPSFKSRWYISLLGFFMSVFLMLKINFLYSLIAFVVIVLMYLWMTHIHKDRRGLQSIFAGALFQVLRKSNVFVQTSTKTTENKWRPAVICLSHNTFYTDKTFKLIKWISYKYGFGTYMHFYEDYYSRESVAKAAAIKEEILTKNKGVNHNVYIDTIISPSYTSAIAQGIQIPGISGMKNNLIIFDYERDNSEEVSRISENISLVRAGDLHIGVFSFVREKQYTENSIHVWINRDRLKESNIMLLLAFIIHDNQDWKNSDIKIFDILRDDNALEDLDFIQFIKESRLPISPDNIRFVKKEEMDKMSDVIKRYSFGARFNIIGFESTVLKKIGEHVFDGYKDMGDILFINVDTSIEIE